MTPQLNQCLKIVTRSPFWAVLPEALASLFTMITTLKQTGQPMSFDAAIGAKPLLGTKEDNKKIAIIPIEGLLTKDGPSWLGTNYDTISNAAERAGADSSIKRIVLAVDSPGGEITGLPETAAVLSRVAKVKPVSAVVHGTAASAAYWLTSQASDSTLTPSGQVGSVGIRMMHADVSKMLEDAGIKVTELYSGDFKTEWSPFKPVTDDAKEDMMRRLVSVHQDFLDAVTQGRGNRATGKIRAARYGEGRMFSANDAIGHGLVDRIQAPRDFFRAMFTTPEEGTSSPASLFGIKRAQIEIEKRRF